jgi:hypothetical protein
MPAITSIARESVEKSDAHPQPTTRMERAAEPLPEDREVVRFEPDPIHPLSPAAQIEPGPLPQGYQARLDEFHRLGTKLADGIPASRRRFQFDTVFNPRRADTLHTEAGHILVTSAFLERVETRHQLAAALAMEMAEVIREDERAGRTSTPTGTAETGRSAVGSVASNPRPAPSSAEEIQSTASKILVRAGFRELDLAVVSRDLQGLFADASRTTKLPTTGELPSRPDPATNEPAWAGPKQTLAN